MRQIFLLLMTVSALVCTPALCADSSDPIRIHRYASGEQSYGANAYWLESSVGIVLIDALMLRSDASILAAAIKSRNKPLAGIIVTHPHLDHFGGLRALREQFPKAPVFATQATVDHMLPAHERAYEQGWIQAFGDDYDRELLIPDSILASPTTIRLAGMGFTITSFGAMEAADNIVVQNLDSGAVFTGDAVLNGHIYYLGEGHSALALRALGEISRRYPAATRAYPAHGDPGVLAAMVERDIAQIRFMRERVVEVAQHAGARTPDGRLSDRARARLVGTFAEHFRNWLSYGLDAATIAQMNLSGLEPEILGELDRAAAPQASGERP